jgi:hypothetical protein
MAEEKHMSDVLDITHDKIECGYIAKVIREAIDRGLEDAKILEELHASAMQGLISIDVLKFDSAKAQGGVVR